MVLIDEFSPRQAVLIDHLKTWADRYPIRAETKGSSAVIRPKVIVVTSNYSIEKCFPDEEDQDAIKRRFRVIYGAPS